MIADFIRILRAADIQVSPAEAIDAAAVIEEIGIGERRLLKHALGHTLAKTQFEKHAFEDCFDVYFKPPEMDLGDAEATSSGVPDEANAADEAGQSQESAGDTSDHHQPRRQREECECALETGSARFRQCNEVVPKFFGGVCG